MNRTAWRAALVVAALYSHFLIFAQFSFIELLRDRGLGVGQEKVLLGAMALAGMVAGFVIAWRGVTPRRVRMALGFAAMAAMLATKAPGFGQFLSLALITGACLGVATVSVSALLPRWCGLAWVGLGTGLGYAVCNLPIIFTATPTQQAWVGAGLAALAALVVPSMNSSSQEQISKPFPLWGAVLVFTALVWMDSAAFFIIQHQAELKQGTWGDGLLWRNAAIHLGLACVAGFWLRSGSARWLMAVALGLLAVAATLVNHPSTLATAGWFYPAAVSMYSTALIVWPGWFSGASSVKRSSWCAAWMFAIAGWFGSANGIAMAEQLKQVPLALVFAACGVLLAVLVFTQQQLWRLWVAAGVALASALLGHLQNSTQPATTAFERGHEVYVSEGCIHCHSQYVRPGTDDEELWGPSRLLSEVLANQPVEIGNRRQGPDLTNVGARRSPKWLELHFKNPRALVPGSWMPSYAYLFEDERGNDLVAYLRESGVQAMPAVMERAAAWEPSADAPADGAALFGMHCATCHGNEGKGDGPLAGQFAKAPANLVEGPFTWTMEGDHLELRLARVVKFGIIGTDMPGHEVMSDAQVNALVAELLRLRGR